MTQLDLAEKLGVSDKSIGNWENGRNVPDLSLFKPLCDELSITINELSNNDEMLLCNLDHFSTINSWLNLTNILRKLNINVITKKLNLFLCKK